MTLFSFNFDVKHIKVYVYGKLTPGHKLDRNLKKNIFKLCEVMHL